MSAAKAAPSAQGTAAGPGAGKSAGMQTAGGRLRWKALLEAGGAHSLLVQRDGEATSLSQRTARQQSLVRSVRFGGSDAATPWRAVTQAAFYRDVNPMSAPGSGELLGGPPATG